MGGGESERRSRSNEVGEPTRGTPRSKGRRRTTESLEGKMTETPSSTTISTKLERIAQQAREAPNMAFKTLAHHIDIDWLREAYRRTRKSGATGVDGQTAKEYASNLETWRATSGRCSTARSPARTERRPCGGSISRRESVRK